LIKYIKRFLWRVAKCLSYVEEVRCLKVKLGPDYKYMRNLGVSSKLSCLFAPKMAAAECGKSLSGAIEPSWTAILCTCCKAPVLSYKR